MADVQLEHGHLRIANSLYRAISLAKLSDSARRVLLECVARQYGWARAKRAPEPFSAMPSSVGRAVGCARETASRALSALVRQCVLRSVGEHRYLLEKDFDRWVCGFHGDPSHVHWTPSGDRDQMITPRDQTVTPPVTVPSHPRDETVTPPPRKGESSSRVGVPLEPVLEPVQNGENAGAGVSARKWNVTDLRSNLGGKGFSVPPVQVPQWLGIIENNDDDAVDAAIQLAKKKDRPLSYFLALFDDEGRRLDDGERPKTKRAGGARRRPTGHVRG